MVQPQLHAASTRDLAVLLCSLASLNYRPSRPFLQAHGAAVRRLLPVLGVRRLSNLLWAHAKLGVRPAEERLLGEMVRMLQGGLQEANARDLASSLWALATLGYTPQRSFLALFGEQVRGKWVMWAGDGVVCSQERWGQLMTAASATPAGWRLLLAMFAAPAQQATPAHCHCCMCLMFLLLSPAHTPPVSSLHRPKPWCTSSPPRRSAT